jgi:hypothetical protein
MTPIRCRSNGTVFMFAVYSPYRQARTEHPAGNEEPERSLRVFMTPFKRFFRAVYDVVCRSCQASGQGKKTTSNHPGWISQGGERLRNLSDGKDVHPGDAR